jgi:hypothetical protein
MVHIRLPLNPSRAPKDLHCTNIYIDIHLLLFLSVVPSIYTRQVLSHNSERVLLGMRQGYIGPPIELHLFCLECENAEVENGDFTALYQV